MSQFSRFQGFRLLPLSAVFALVVSACSTTPVAEQPVAAEKPAEAAPVLPSVELTPEVLYNVLLGEIAGRRGEYGLSVRALSNAARETGDPRLAERATLAAIYAKRYAEALDTGRMWVSLRPDDEDAREALATVMLALDRPDEAKEHFEKMLELSKKDNRLGHTYLRIAAVLGRHENRTDALSLMTSLTRQNPGNAEAQFALAHMGMRAGNLSIASGAIDRALIIRAGWEDAALLKARILGATNDHKRTIQFYEKYLSTYPESSKMRMNYARYLVDQKNWEGAREQFKVVLESSPENIDVLYALGLLSLQTERLEDADVYFRRALDINPANDQMRIYLGQTAERREQLDVAVSWYKSVSNEKYLFEARTRLGVVIAKQGDLAKGREILSNIKPVNDQERVQLALAEEQVLRDAKEYNAALKVLSDALKALPKHKDLLYARALVAEKLNDLSLHERDLRLVLKLDPQNAHAMNALGYTLADRTDRHQEAYALIKHALELRPNDPFILDSMGWVQYRLGNSAEAIRYLRRALEIRFDAEISAHLGEVLWVSGKEHQAERVWAQALKREPDNESVKNTIKKFKQ
jgi:tetratricopeptide (TPR) repeat protein